MRLHILGTGNATVTKCYNTCFALEDNGEFFLVDCGGGNRILGQLKEKNIKLKDIHNMFITHEHCDHILGTVWLVRMIATEMSKGKYDGEFNIYCHETLKNVIKMFCEATLQKKFTKLFDDRIIFHDIENGSKANIIGSEFEFFNIGSTKAMQHGFMFDLDGGRLVFMGDEPISTDLEYLAQDAKWLLSEAFCLYSQREKYKPYEKHHATVADNAKLAQKLNVQNLLLWHTEEDNIDMRKELYTSEAKEFFDKNIFVPDDLETIEL